jgi:ribosomal protein S18 acetylase RimI-like enzyme
MLDLLVEGRQANNGTYYIHTGDLLWWLFYPPRPFDFSQHIFLWEEAGRLLGWCLLTPEEGYMDVFICPRERGSARVESLYAWAEARLTDRVKAQGGSSIRQMLVREDDTWLSDLKRRSGFTVGDKCMVLNHRELAGPLPDPALPEGYRVQTVGGIEAGQKRAAASHAAFGSRLPFDQYWPRYRRFMESPAYAPERDLIAVAPDGRAASFCVFWLDPVNRAGYFEPVGTHPDFQRRGLGRAVLCEGLRRMKDQGMLTATVCAYDDNRAAIGLYESVGFRIVNKLLTYTKDV